MKTETNNYYKGIKPFHKQFSECSEEGFHKETEFESFEKHPELLPAPFHPKLIKLIKSGKIKGIEFIVCGKFGGRCNSGHPECRKLRGWTE